MREGATAIARLMMEESGFWVRGTATSYGYGVTSVTHVLALFLRIGGSPDGRRSVW